MSILGDLAVKAEMTAPLEFIDRNNHLPPKEQLELYRREIERIRTAATMGRPIKPAQDN